jgi:uncharacterized lipoprotein YehR (DUF1307 family)
MKKIALLAALVAVFSLSGCGDSPQERAQKEAAPPSFWVVGTNPNDGCTVNGFYRYNQGQGFYTVCAGKPVQTTREYDENCGKNCRRHVVVTTLNGTPADAPASDTKAQ